VIQHHIKLPIARQQAVQEQQQIHKIGTIQGLIICPIALLIFQDLPTVKKYAYEQLDWAVLEESYLNQMP
jgi:ABC-type nickel/cobalt efflux system permease component RcnA